MKKEKNSKKVILYSFLLTGWGQFYHNKRKLGIILMVFSVFGLITSLTGVYLIFKSYIYFSNYFNTVYCKVGIGLLSLGFLVMISVGGYSVIDSYKTVKEKEELDKKNG